MAQLHAIKHIVCRQLHTLGGCHQGDCPLVPMEHDLLNKSSAGLSNNLSIGPSNNNTCLGIPNNKFILYFIVGPARIQDEYWYRC